MARKVGAALAGEDAERVSWPLVGRAREISLLKQSITGRRGAVVTGPAGAGKTALAMVGVEFARDHGIAVAIAAGTPSARTHPFGAFASLLHQESDPFGPAESHAEILRRCTRELLSNAGRRHLLIFVDDAHLLDDGSAMLVHQVAQTGSATVLACVLASGRAGHPAADPMVVLWKDLGAARIELGPLDAEAVADLLLAVLGGPVEAASTRELIGRSLGDPLFLHELVAGAVDDGTLCDENGVWRLRGPLQPTTRLVELVTRRLGDLTDEERHALELTALGEPLAQPTLDELADRAAIGSLEDRGLLTSRMDGRRLQVCLAHPVFGDVIRLGISPRRARALARSLADATTGRRRDDTLLLASLRLVGGGGSAELLLAGAHAARERRDFELAERMARAATDGGAGFDARLLAAEATHLRGRHEQAALELDALALEATDVAELVQVALLRFDHSFFLRGDADPDALDALLDVVEDPIWRDELTARRLRLQSLRSGPSGVVDATAHPGPSMPPGSLHVVLGENLTRAGRGGEALRLLAPTDVPPRAAIFPEPWSGVGSRALALVGLGRLGEAHDVLTTAHRDLVAAPVSLESASIAACLGALHLEQGRVQSAFMQATSAAAIFLDLGQRVSARWSYALSAYALALAGVGVRATETLATLDGLALPVDMACEVDVLLAHAWASVAGGDMGTARQNLEVAVAVGLEAGDRLGATRALHSLARMGRAREVADQLADLAPRVGGDLTAARLDYARAAAGRDSEALAAAATRFEELGALLYAAEARGESAVQLRRGGSARDAAAAQQSAARLLERCEGAKTPFVSALGARALLTPAELDTALHAATGSTDKEIAELMHLSVRTVENRLHRVYQKLGLSHRGDLPDALRGLPGG
jgi:DNA-binding CsgD family transcriptional regulator